MNELTLRDKAVNTHARIMTNGQVLQNTLLEICKDLKSMRDERLYLQLGYETFEEYAEKAVGLKQRQAYSYISTYEKLGPKYLEENSSLGITKLELISQIDSYEREEFIAEENVESLSVRELKEKVDEYKKQNEQLTFQLEELSQSPKEVIPDETVSKENEELKAKIEELTEELTNAQKEAETTTKVVDEEEIKKQVSEIEQKYKEKLKKEKASVNQKIENAVNEAEKKSADKINSLQQENEKLQRQKTSIEAKLDEAERKAKVTGADPQVTMLKVYFDELQDTSNTLVELLSKLSQTDTETVGKLKPAIIGVLQSTAKNIESI